MSLVIGTIEDRLATKMESDQVRVDIWRDACCNGHPGVISGMIMGRHHPVVENQAAEEAAVFPHRLTWILAPTYALYCTSSERLGSAGS